MDWRSVATNNDSRRNPIPTRPRPLRHLMRRGPIHAVAVRQTARGGVNAKPGIHANRAATATRLVSITKVTNASDNPATAGSEAVAAGGSVQLSGTLKRSQVPEPPRTAADRLKSSTSGIVINHRGKEARRHQVASGQRATVLVSPDLACMAMGNGQCPFTILLKHQHKDPDASAGVRNTVA